MEQSDNVDNAVALSSSREDEKKNGVKNREQHRIARLESGDRKDLDSSAMAKFGKKPQLKRRFNSLSSIGVICGSMLTWVALMSSLQFGLINGGPAGLIYGYIAAWFGATLQALVMAEISSMIPLTGGPFNWVAVLAPDSCRNILSYVSGCLTVAGWQIYVAATSFACATEIQGLLILNHPEYEPKSWHSTLLTYAVVLFACFVNTYMVRVLPQFESLNVIIYVLGFIATLVPVAYLSPHRSAREVFDTFQNLGGWKTQGLSFMVGWYTSTTSFNGADGSEHIAEEVYNAPVTIPFSIWVSILLNGVLGFALMIAVVFSIQDLAAATTSVTGYPIIDIYVSATGSRSGGTALMSVLIAINIMSTVAIVATASRTLWAFSRENALPFSWFFHEVNPKTRLPLNAIATTVTITMLLSLIAIGSTATYDAFFAAYLAAYLSAFVLSAGTMLHKRLTTPSAEIPWGPFRLGRIGTPITIIAIAYSILAMFWAFWPVGPNPSKSDMNYSCVLYGGALILIFFFWFIHGRYVYRGPIWELGSRTTL